MLRRLNRQERRGGDLLSEEASRGSSAVAVKREARLLGMCNRSATCRTLAADPFGHCRHMQRGRMRCIDHIGRQSYMASRRPNTPCLATLHTQSTEARSGLDWFASIGTSLAAGGILVGYQRDGSMWPLPNPPHPQPGGGLGAAFPT